MDGTDRMLRAEIGREAQTTDWYNILSVIFLAFPSPSICHSIRHSRVGKKAGRDDAKEQGLSGLGYICLSGVYYGITDCSSHSNVTTQDDLTSSKYVGLERVS
ncbi:hypothetical protein VTN00DRAFT_5716 [Thermoascus crustaceus]|uniref:uncharacterized protein n=1 Tax=Thermoascus crustaceus TaxID=5088 RepID=UPI0037444159